ncbi:radical SAM protein, partial [Treponema sp.]|uniref:radical SAM protein n=1 Tax=Treponema sp. TaxID=166 RepID=UPI002A8072BE
MKLIKPLETFGPLLNSVQVPSRYVGGEFGVTIKEHSDNERLFNFAVAFPDMYEIAMSNLAVKIIYNGLNQLPNVRCERVFAPAPDFEELLKSNDVPLYTLETGMPLSNTDMIGFSIGYELGITEVLAMLEDGKVPAFASDRKGGDPIVIAGGCGVTNPAPFSDFFDAFIIGEAEPVLFELVSELASMKEKGASREEMISLMETKKFIWTKRKCTGSEKKVARRAVQNNFGLVPSIPSWFPLPSNRPVQDHGVIEIMRGCPNGCRFCHAGVYYRPTRVKNLKLIIDEIDHLVFDAGYREISLNSLSSADFPDVGGLLDLLNERYRGFNVSFQLPSLKVNSMSLDILEKLSSVRKSGLTFAVETPTEMWQLSLNKEVYAQHLEEIVREAKKRGWSSAKFYFMIGLPLGDYFSDKKLEPGAEGTEERAIVDFLLPLQGRTK